MNWQAISFDWNQVRAFLATAEEGSLSAAARALGQTQPTLSRQVSALEKELGVTLFERGHRSMQLTDAGVGLLEHVRSMAQAATRLSLAASGQSQQIEGDVRLTATPLFATYHLPPILARLREAAPGVRIEVVAANELRDLRRREADISIRHVRPEEPTLMARRVGGTTVHLYATPAYLDRVGRPASMQGMAHLDFLGFESPTRTQQILRDFDIEIRREQVPLCSTSGTVLLALLEQHLGVSFVPRDLAELRGNLELVLPEMPPIEIPLWLVTHQELHTSARIRVVFDFLVEELSALPEATSE